MGSFRQRDSWEPGVIGTELLKPLYSKIVGVTRYNPDGTSRQDLLAQCKIGQPLRLVREPDNPVDSNAVMVLTMERKQLGYINRSIAPHVAAKLDRGVRIDCEISDLTGGKVSMETRGCNIKIVIHGLICTSCGKGVPVDSKYCPECGNEIDPTDRSQHKAKGCFLGCFGFVVIVLLVLMVIGAIVGNKPTG